MIIKNAIRCNICGDEIESMYRHDFVECSCGACAVDGGHDYLRRCFKKEGFYTDISICKPAPGKRNNPKRKSHSFVQSCGSSSYQSIGR